MNLFSLSKSIIRPVIVLAALVLAITVGCGCSRRAGPAPDAAAVTQAKPEPSGPVEQAEQAEKPSQSAPNSQIPPEPEQPDGPKLQLTQEGVTLAWHEDGKLRMEARAKSLKADEISRTGTLLDFSARLYENGKLTAEIRAPSAVVDTDKRVVTASGGVTLKSVERATTVNAQQLRWYARQNKVVGSAGVKIESAMGVITAAAFEADTSLKTLTVEGSAKGLKL